MNPQGIAAILTAATALVTALGGLVRAIRTDKRLQRHEAAVGASNPTNGGKHAGSPYGGR